MNFTPFAKYKIETILSTSEVISRIKDNTRIVDSFEIILNQPKEYFWGKVSNESFEIYRKIVWTRNSFIPFYKGNIEEEKSKTTIELKVNPNPFGKVLLTIVLICCIIFPFFYYFYQADLFNYLLISYVLLVVLVVLFNKDKKEHLQKLYEIVEGESLIEL